MTMETYGILRIIPFTQPLKEHTDIAHLTVGVDAVLGADCYTRWSSIDAHA